MRTLLCTMEVLPRKGLRPTLVGEGVDAETLPAFPSFPKNHLPCYSQKVNAKGK